MKRQTHEEYKVWQHNLWPEFQEWRSRRDEHAGKIVANYAKKPRLLQLEMNYQTILKHASKGKLDQYDIGEKTYLYQTPT